MVVSFLQTQRSKASLRIHEKEIGLQFSSELIHAVVFMDRCYTDSFPFRRDASRAQGMIEESAKTWCDLLTASFRSRGGMPSVPPAFEISNDLKSGHFVKR